MKKVLIIAYHFPPDSAVGAVRSAKFAKYLPEFGWEPIIYTVKERYYESCDYSRFEPALKPLKIYRANLIPGLLSLYSRLIHKANSSPSNTSDITRSLTAATQNKVNPLKRLLSSLAWVPDDKQGWILNIVKDGYRIIREHKIDVFITSGPPISTHIGGLLLKNITHTKWVADFRDPWWPGVHWKGGLYRTTLSDAIEKKLESKVIRRTDLLISTAPSVTDYLKSNLPSSQQEKCITITNGFDESDFSGISQAASVKKSKTLIVYAGTLYVGRDPEPFLAALQKLSLRNELDKDRIVIEFIGHVAYYNNVSVLGLIEKYGLESFVKLSGRIPFKMCIERLLSSSALLFFSQDYPEQIPAKVFEYLRMNKPIFALTNEGDAKNILNSFENVFTADPDNIDDIAEKFAQMLKAMDKNEPLLSPREKLNKYDRRYLTEELAVYLEQISREFNGPIS